MSAGFALGFAGEAGGGGDNDDGGGGGGGGGETALAGFGGNVCMNPHETGLRIEA